MTRNKYWFANLRTLKVVYMLIGSNQMCSIEGLGIVAIKQYDSSVITLSDVKWVHNLRRNILSVSKLSVSRPMSVFKNQLVEITKIEMGRVVMIGNMIGNLYILRGDNLVALDTQTKTNSDLRKTVLRQRSLDHVGTNNLRELQNKE